MCSPHSSSLLSAYLLQSITLRIATAVFYETGEHMNGEVLAFAYQGQIPAGADQFKLDVAHEREGLEEEYTYFRVEVPLIYKKFVIGCNSVKKRLCVFVTPEVYPRDIMVTGYAMPKAGFTGSYDDDVGAVGGHEEHESNIDDLSDHRKPHIRPWISGGPLMFTNEKGEIIIKL